MSIRRPSFRIRFAALILLVLALVIVEGNRRVPTPAATGYAFDGSPATSQPVRSTLRVATFNIAGGVGKDDRFDLQRTVDSLRNFDIIGMQEVHGRTFSDSRDQAHMLGDMLQEPYLYAPAETRWWHDSFGNGALCSLPVTFWQRFPFSNAGADTNRALLFFRVQWGERNVNVIVVHMGRHQDHEAELKSSIALFMAMQPPAILMGDMNPIQDDANADPPLRELRHTPNVVDAIGPFIPNGGSINLDWIFARGLESVTGGFIDKGASDHPVAWAELK